MAGYSDNPMSAEVQSQFYLFFLAIFWGIGMCLVYDTFKIFRKLVPHSPGWINIEDVFYWAVMTVLLFYLLFTYNRGEIRSFTIAGILTGSIFYIKTISSVYISLIAGFYNLFCAYFQKSDLFWEKLLNYFWEKGKIKKINNSFLVIMKISGGDKWQKKR